MTTKPSAATSGPKPAKPGAATPTQETDAQRATREHLERIAQSTQKLQDALERLREARQQVDPRWTAPAEGRGKGPA